MAEDDLIAWERLRRDAERRGAFGALRTDAERRDADRERAVRLAADTLLDKALRRGDSEAGARKLVDRALTLSVPGSEPGEEGALAVHLFVWDALREVALDPAHPDWLDRAEAATPDGVGRSEWLAALRAVAGEGEIDQDERRRIRVLAGPAGDHDPFAGVPHDERVAATLQLLAAVRAVTA
ncbi:hypothetical protein [Amnibacterium kyonggiense]|uniref:Uncharacterized protein n=1 Tax=Amnibacterium kyonggiense TaxID=595671 RepID=A0A4R7FLA3_9MICO|nr:hypothetical protein [Amnibacterium kyonggiense]TDS77147.1 hypothetical protein CLV52_2087 [Amnibacterium kyonggiense]